MNDHKSNRNAQFFNNTDNDNNFWQYIQSLSPEAITNLSQPASPEVFQVMEKNIMGMLGNLPSDHFNIMVSTSRENLGKLLASAMMSGYFLRNAEQRMDFEKTMMLADDSSDNQSAQ